jgi:hypothetical protein
VRRSRYLAEHTKRRSLTGAAGAAAAGREENWVTVAHRNGIGESLHVGGVTCY